MATVYVLGAGASHALNEKSPLNNQLLPEILKNQRRRKVNPLRVFVADFYHVDYNAENYEKQLPAIEDVLSQLDFALLENRPLSPTYDLQYLQKIREQFITGICQLLGTNLT